MRLDIEDRLVEQAVIAIERAPRAHFHREREALYAVADAEKRDRAFADLHARWFRRLGLDGPLRQALGEQPRVQELIDRCTVSAVVRAEDEGSQLYVRSRGAAGTPGRHLALRMRASSLVDPKAALALLRSELLHVADMLDPTFGYHPQLPPSSGGPLEDRLLVERYAAAWAATVAGRLVRRHLLPESALETSWARLRRAFPAAGEDGARALERLFHHRPTHAELVRLAQHPRAPRQSGEAAEGASICPLCQMPAFHLEAVEDPRSQAAIAADFPSWKQNQRVCPRCAEVYAQGTAAQARCS